MDKKPWHGLHRGLPRSYKTDEQVRAQWESGPKVLGPSIATLLAQPNKASKAAKSSEKKPPG